ncbi:DUF5667 domain-containing protein [Candidatus Uhrbacteria bacterium]|nr:DUF5667 domain-containing protein [Candidatus Uhrbacteria bacterium]
MSASLHERLRTLRTVTSRVEPDAAWMRSTRATLLMQARNSMPTAPVRSLQTAEQAFRFFAPHRLIHAMRGPVMAVFSILAIALGGSIASVSAAEHSLPGDFLYALKLATEQARLALTSAKEEKLKLKVEYTSRRGEELKKVASEDVPQKEERVAQAAEILKRDLKTVKEQLDDVRNTASDEKTVVEAAKLVDQKSGELVQALQETKTTLSDGSKSKVTEVQAAAADTGVKAIEVLAEKHEQSNESVPKDDVVRALQDYTKTVAGVTGSTSFTASSTALTDPESSSSTSLQTTVQQVKVAAQQAFAEQKTAADAATADAAATTDATASTSSTDATTSSTDATTSSTDATASSTEPTPP